MNNLKQESLNKSRSYTACISASHRMLFDNIRTIFKHTWLYALLLALSMSMMSMFYIKALIGGGYSSSSFICLVVSLLLVVCFQVGYTSRVLMLLNCQTMMWNVKRYLRLILLYLCVSFAVSAIQWILMYLVIGGTTSVPSDKMPVTMLLIACSSLFFACVLLPYVYVFMKYMMEPESKLSKLLFKVYKTGLRYWGFIFITLLLAFLCVAVCMFFVSIPMLVITMANTLSVMGVSYLGDSSGLPSYFDFLQYMIVAVSSFICLYINIFIIFVFYFMYGSIETREKERKDFFKMR